MSARTIIGTILKSIGIRRNPLLVPPVSVTDAVGTVDIEPLENEQRDGNVTLEELTIISQIVKNRKPLTIFEIGTFDGRTTLNLANFSPADACVYTLDLPKKDLAKAKFGIEAGDSKYVNKETIGGRYGKNSDKINQLYGDSATFDFFPYHGKIDFVFVDGSHSAPYAKNDSEVALKLVRPGGIILWHDYGVWRGVTKVLNSYYSNDPRFKEIRRIDGTSFVVMGV